MPELNFLSGYSFREMIFAAMVIGSLFLVIQSIIGLMTQAQMQMTMNRRLQFKSKYASTSEAMIELRKSRGLDVNGNLFMPVEWINRLIVQSGLKYDPVKWLVLAFASGIIGAVAAFILTRMFLVSLLVFPLMFMTAPLILLHQIAAARSKKMSIQLSDALQVACRSLEAGHPVATSIALVAKEMPDPIGTEFGMAADEVSYGASLTDAIQRLAERSGDADVELFAATVRLQERTGGNLCDLLKGNVDTIRERQTMRLKVKAASSEGRMSALILTAAPFIVMLAIHLLKPEFFGSVIHMPTIQYSFVGLGVWMLIGNLIMRNMINFKI